jgi:GST-like protein
MGLEYRTIEVDVLKGEQYDETYAALNPNNKVPALVDDTPTDGGEPLAVFESGAILVYLAEKVRRFLPETQRERIAVMQWVFWQMASLGPIMGQTRHFLYFAREPQAYAIERFTAEARRLYGVLNRQLARGPYLCGEYSIADMACWTWLLYTRSNRQNLAEHPNVERWFRTVESRPAVRAVAARYWEGLPIEQAQPLDRESQRILFGWQM